MSVIAALFGVGFAHLALAAELSSPTTEAVRATCVARPTIECTADLAYRLADAGGPAAPNLNAGTRGVIAAKLAFAGQFEHAVALINGLANRSEQTKLRILVARRQVVAAARAHPDQPADLTEFAALLSSPDRYTQSIRENFSPNLDLIRDLIGVKSELSVAVTSSKKDRSFKPDARTRPTVAAVFSAWINDLDTRRPEPSKYEWRAYVWALIDAGRLTEATSLVEKVAAPGDWDSDAYRAVMWRALGDPDRALEAIDMAMADRNPAKSSEPEENWELSQLIDTAGVALDQRRSVEGIVKILDRAFSLSMRQPLASDPFIVSKRRRIITIAGDAGAQAEALAFVDQAADLEKTTNVPAYGLLQLAAACIDINQEVAARRLLDEVSLRAAWLSPSLAEHFRIDADLQRYRLGDEQVIDDPLIRKRSGGLFINWGALLAERSGIGNPQRLLERASEGLPAVQKTLFKVSLARSLLQQNQPAKATVLLHDLGNEAQTRPLPFGVLLSLLRVVESASLMDVAAQTVGPAARSAAADGDRAALDLALLAALWNARLPEIQAQ